MMHFGNTSLACPIPAEKIFRMTRTSGASTLSNRRAPPGRPSSGRPGCVGFVWENSPRARDASSGGRAVPIKIAASRPIRCLISPPTSPSVRLDAPGRPGPEPPGSSQPAGDLPAGCSRPPPHGGSEGLAMLNRTNRKLSANHLGLNLGTRMLALKAGVNFGNLTLLPVARPQLVRAGDPGDPGRGWADPIILRSYPPMPMSAASPEAAGSSPRHLAPMIEGLESRTPGPIAALASRIAAAPPLAARAARHHERFELQPEPSQAKRLGSGRFGTFARVAASQRPVPCAQVPDATP